MMFLIMDVLSCMRSRKSGLSRTQCAEADLPVRDRCGYCQSLSSGLPSRGSQARPQVVALMLEGKERTEPSPRQVVRAPVCSACARSMVQPLFQVTVWNRGQGVPELAVGQRSGRQEFA